MSAPHYPKTLNIQLKSALNYLITLQLKKKKSQFIEFARPGEGAATLFSSLAFLPEK